MAAQRLFGLLPRGNELNYLLQRYVTRSLDYHPDWFEYKVQQAVSHLTAWHRYKGDGAPLCVMEIGTGWFPVVAVALALAGAQEVLTVDRVGALRPRQLGIVFRAYCQYLDDHRLDDIAAPQPERLAILRRLATEDEPPLSSLSELGVRPIVADARSLPQPTSSIDLFVSNNTFEHIDRPVLGDILAEHRRMAKPGALASHFVDMTDHYFYTDPRIGPLHFLSYTETQWRRRDNSIVPQNRLRLSDHRRLLENAGFCVVDEDRAWVTSEEVLASLKIVAPFTRYPAEELRVHGVWFTGLAMSRTDVIPDSR